MVAILFIASLSLLMDSLDRVKQLDLFLSFFDIHVSQNGDVLFRKKYMCAYKTCHLFITSNYNYQQWSGTRIASPAVKVSR